MWVFPKNGVPQNGWFIMEKPMKMDDLGVITTIFGNIHVPTTNLGSPGVPFRLISREASWFTPKRCHGTFTETRSNAVAAEGMPMEAQTRPGKTKYKMEKPSIFSGRFHDEHVFCLVGFMIKNHRDQMKLFFVQKK